MATSMTFWFEPITGIPHAASGIEIYDAHEGNVLFDKNGNMAPIDVWVNDPKEVLR